MNYPDPNGSILDVIDSRVLEKLYEELNVDTKWRTLNAIVPKEYALCASKIESSIALGVSHRINPASELIRKYDLSGMKVSTLTKSLFELKLQNILLELVPIVPYKIIKDPVSEQQIEVGQSWSVTCEADGLPFPKYQWFKEKQLLIGEIHKTLIKKEVVFSDSGVYICRVYQPLPNNQTKNHSFSGRTSLSVIPNNKNQIVAGFSMPQSENNSHYYSARIVKQPLAHISADFRKPVVIECLAEGTNVLYQWYHKSTKLPGKNASLLKLPSCLYQHEGEYYCEVLLKYQEEDKSVRSESCYLTVKKCDNIDFSIHILDHPKDRGVYVHEDVQFEVKANAGPKSLQFKWYHDNKPIEGQNKPVLKIQNVSKFDRGIYQCRVSCDPNLDEMTNQARLDVTEYNSASCKVALLMGGRYYEEYEEYGELPAVEEDLRVFRKFLERQGFRVLSFMDLTKDEMMNAIDEFVKYYLIPECYVVLFVCGHGYEKSGQCYLIPSRGGIQESVCVQEIIQKLQTKLVAMLLVIVDVCRKLYNLNGDEVTTFIPEPRNNCNIIYSTSLGQKAYEAVSKEGNCSSFLMTHLVNILNTSESSRKNITIHELFSFLGELMSRDKELRDKQMVPVLGTTGQTERSLFDNFSPGHYAKEVDAMSLRHELNHELPVSFMYRYLGGDIKYLFKCVSVLSNLMLIQITVCPSDTVQDFCFTNAVVPSDLRHKSNSSDNWKVKFIWDNITSTYALGIYNIQRLKESLTITLYGSFTMNGTKKLMTLPVKFEGNFLKEMHLNKTRKQ